jgi:hypothetical protein
MFLDVTDVVSYNVELLNRNALPRSSGSLTIRPAF